MKKRIKYGEIPIGTAMLQYVSSYDFYDSIQVINNNKLYQKLNRRFPITCAVACL